MDKTVNYVETLKKLNEMLAPDFDWEKYFEEDNGFDFEETLDRFPCFQVGNSSKVFECGSYKVSDTPKGLYRALWLFKPQKVNFSDMYGCELFCVISPDNRFLVQFYLYKYELGLYFFCDKKALGGKKNMVTCGNPGYSNGTQCVDPDGLLFFEVVKKLLETPHEIYSGNNFKV